LTLGLLCGGQGRRLGGPKESLVDDVGATLLQHQLDRLSPHFQEVLLLVGPRATSFSHFLPLAGIRQVCDPLEFSGQGPLAGLLAALQVCRDDWLALMAIDTPFFPPEVLTRSLEMAPEGCPAVGFRGPEGRPQWLPGLYRKRLQTSIEATLLRGELSLGRWMQSQQHAFLPWTDPLPVQRAYANLNTPEQARHAGFRLPLGPGGREAFNLEGRSPGKS
jgi:molybdopterin-guanine dinucleotide biosynthesis protein A